ncbi:hypothetical protein WA158_001121 [Blastocystis sp. Blastoise]
MVKEKVLLDINKLNKVKEDIDMYEEMLKDVVNVFSSVFTFITHSTTSISKSMKHTCNDCIERKADYSSYMKESTNEANNEVDVSKNDSTITESDTNIDFIRFTNNGVIHQIPKTVIESIPYSYIYEQSAEELRTNDGAIYLGYDGNDAIPYYFLDYLNNKEIDFDTFEYEEQLELIHLFEFCNLPLPEDLTFSRMRRGKILRNYNQGNEVDLIINGKKDDIIKSFLIRNGKWMRLLDEYHNDGSVDVDPVDNSLYIEKKYQYGDYIHQVIEYEDSDDEDYDQIFDDFRLKKMEFDIRDLFGDDSVDSDKNNDKHIFQYFVGTTILKKCSMERNLVVYLGKIKKWKLLYRASEHDYSASEFHKYCDNKGETVTLIKASYNHDKYIIAGYTNQNWESPQHGYWKPYSTDFVVQLRDKNGSTNKYIDLSKDNEKGIYCCSSSGPTFGNGQIMITDRCRSNNNSKISMINIPIMYPRDYDNNYNRRYNQYISNYDKYNSRYNTNSIVINDYEVWGRDN